jgi:acid phosphatase
MSRLVGFVLAALASVAAFGQQPVLPTPAHIVIVIEENKGFDDIIGNDDAAYINDVLVKNGALLTNFCSLHHPSQPNYVELFAGDTLTVCDDTCPPKLFDAVNLGSALLAAHPDSFLGFAENLPDKPRACPTPIVYARKHCPWTDFSNVPDSASRDFKKFPKTDAGFDRLPLVSFVIPNLWNDMHNGSIEDGDEWLRKRISKYADWAMKNNSLLIVTWDEDSDTSYRKKLHCPGGITTVPPQNRIATIIVGEPVKKDWTSSDPYTHLDLLRTILDMAGLPPFAGAVTAKDITGIWK